MAENRGMNRREIFQGILERAWQASGLPVPALTEEAGGKPVPHLSENWYCCAEPTSEQLTAF
jgi:hypothetical protein